MPAAQGRRLGRPGGPSRFLSAHGKPILNDREETVSALWALSVQNVKCVFPTQTGFYGSEIGPSSSPGTTLEPTHFQRE